MKQYNVTGSTAQIKRLICYVMDLSKIYTISFFILSKELVNLMKGDMEKQNQSS